MQTEIRPLEPGDHLRHRELMEQAFGKGSVVPEPEHDAAPSDVANIWGLFAGGELQAALSIVPFQTHWGTQTILPLGGIAGVATWVEARGNGYVAELLTESLRVMRDRGEVVSALYPFSWSFYRKFGWEWVGEKRTMTLPLRELRAHPEGKSVRDITERDAQAARPKIEAVYTTYAKQFRGAFTSETHRWNSRLDHKNGRAAYVYEYEPTGEYLLWRYENDGRGKVVEWTARTPEGVRAHLSLLHYLGTQCDKAEVTVPSNSPLQAHFMHWDMETKVRPIFMGRVVDFAGAMRVLPPIPDAPNGSLMLAVRDDYAPWNNGTWRVGVENGIVFCDKAPEGTSSPDVAIDTQALSQAFWGYPSLEWLRAAGRIDTVNDETAWTLLFHLLPAHPVYTMDDF